MPSRTNRSSRRRFLKNSISAAAVLAGTGAASQIVKSDTVSPAEKLNLAFVGVNGKTPDALNQFSTLNCNYVAALRYRFQQPRPSPGGARRAAPATPTSAR